MSERVRAAVGLVTLAILFGMLEWLWPENRLQPKYRSGLVSDALWWFAGYGTRFLGSVSAVVLAVVVMRLVPLSHPWVPQISLQPGWLQAFEVIFIGDFLGYWIYRLFHGNTWLWAFHAIHHSSEQLDWLCATRVHPIGSIAHRLVLVALFYLLGYSGALLGPFLLFLALTPIALHANLALRFGPPATSSSAQRSTAGITR
jgi:sterol desaturase/sphingolipid hydroxylase (fatty acid hydroxylase superfamily)